MRAKNWDSGVSYDICKARIVRAIEVNQQNPSRLVKCYVYAIQLRNGSRISEATDALKDFYKGIKEIEVLVRKKKKWKTHRDEKTYKLEFVLNDKGKKIRLADDYREMLWPEFIDKPDFKDKDIQNEVRELSKKQAQDSCRKIINVNSHSLRYARITELSDKGVNDSVIAKITHHSDLKFIMKYQQEKVAKRINREIQ